MKILIIGNSAAGTAAIEAIRGKDRDCSIVLLSDELHPLYSRCLLSYYLSGAIPREKLLYRDKGFHQKMGVRLHTGKRAVRLDADNRQVACSDGSVFEYDKLLIATGSSAKLPENIPGNIDGVHVLRTLDDAEAVRRTAKRAGHAVVLGGGLIGMKAACALAESGLETKVIVRSSRVLSQMIDDAASQIVIRRLSESGIEVLLRTDVSEIQSQKNKLVAVKTDQKQTIPCELLIVAKGVQPNTELVQDTDIRKEWGIVTDSFIQTNHSEIFAAGDVAETLDITTGEHAVNALWTCAVQQGRIAGLNMTGRTVPYDGAVGMNSLNIGGLSMISYGVTAPKDESKYRVLVHYNPAKNIYKKILLQDHRIKGIILLGRIQNAGVLLSLIRRKTDVSEFEDGLLDDQFNFGSLLRTGDPAVLENYRLGFVDK